jgi:hypothetical protein
LQLLFSLDQFVDQRSGGGKPHPIGMEHRTPSLARQVVCSDAYSAASIFFTTLRASASDSGTLGRWGRFHT